jgi:nucleoside-diphosphate-sugar epimerase
MTRALVTGGGGFLGRAIVEQLRRRGDEVTIFARGRYPEVEALGVRAIRGDIRDPAAITEACRGMDVVFHVAAKAGLWGPWEAFYSVNVEGTNNVIAACRASGVRRLINTSSPSVVFDGTAQEGANESVPYPETYESPYPETKALAEQRVSETNGSDLLTVSLRPHLIFGPRDNHLIPSLLARAKDGQVPQVGDGTNRVDLTYVEDAAYAHLLADEALATDPSLGGSVYFISQDEPVALWPWIRDLLAKLDLPPIRRRIPLPVARAAGRVMATAHRVLPLGGEPRLTPFLASELAESHYYDISRAKRELGYAPRYSMVEAKAKTIAWFRTHPV